MTTRARGCLARTALLGVLAAGLVLGGQTASASPTQAAVDAALHVNFQTSTVPADGDFSMLLRVTDAPAASDLVVRIYDRIETSAQLFASEGDDPDNLLATFDPVELAAGPDTVPEQPAGFTINLYSPGQPRPPSNWAYRLSQAGVYPLEVRLRDASSEVLTSFFTYLVREPDADDQVTPTPVSLLTSVHRRPALVPERRIATDRADPTLVERLGPVLDAFAAHPTVPAAFAVTPDNAVQLAGDPDARTVLESLRSEVAGPTRELLAAPYVRIDPAALVSNGLVDEVTRQAELGRRTLSTTLVEPVADTWYLDRRLDDSGVQALRRRGISQIVVPSSLTVGSPTGPGTVTAKGSGVVASPVTSGFDLGGGRSADARLEGYRVLGRLAALSTIRSGEGAITVRVIATSIDPVELGVVLDGLADANPYLRPELLTAQLARAASSGARIRLRRPASVDLSSYARRSAFAHQLVASYGSMVPDQPERAAAFERPLALSASVDLPLAQRNRDLDRVAFEVQGRFGQVSVPARDTVRLGARDATIPLVITSKLGHPARVVIQLQASDRLDFPEDRIEATITGERSIVNIRVHTRGSGDTPLLITTRTPDGTVVLGQTRYTIRSTAVSGVGVVLTIGAGLFLALWWGRHLLRHRRRAKRGRSRFGGRRPDPAPLDTAEVLIADPPAAHDVTDQPPPGSNPG